MARSPFKFVRFLVWASAGREYREDALIAFEEGFEQACANFGPLYAHWWSLSQAVRSLPYGLIINLVRLGVAITALMS